MTSIAYDPTELSGNMHLTEAEIRLALQMNNETGFFRGDYASIKSGDALILTGEGPAEMHDKPFICKLRLFNVEGGITTIINNESMGVGEVGPSFRERPHCKMFEAVVLKCKRLDMKPGDEAFGFLFLDNFAIMVDSGPEDDLTNRRILAMLALVEHGRGGI